MTNEHIVRSSYKDKWHNNEDYISQVNLDHVMAIHDVLDGGFAGLQFIGVFGGSTTADMTREQSIEVRKKFEQLKTNQQKYINELENKIRMLELRVELLEVKIK